jgi:Flp pilus assembly protein TadG
MRRQRRPAIKPVPSEKGRHGRLRGQLAWWRDERGALTLFVAILFPALLCFAGLVIDAGTKLDNYENAATYAQEAARAGAGQVDQNQAYSNSTFVVDRAQAVAAANAYLAGAGLHDYQVQPVGANSIRVTVTITTPTKILSIFGIDTVSSQAVATATLVSGVTGPGS